MAEKIHKVWMFIVIHEGMEKIVLWPNEHGQSVPLVYFSKDVVNDDNLRGTMQRYAEQYTLFIELREYQLVPNSEEKFYPSKENYNA